jgi:hypothetical protein
MIDLIHFVYEYRKLLARRDLLGARLDPDGRERLEALERLFAPGEEEARSHRVHRRRYARCDLDLRATIKMAGRVHVVRVVNLGGGGMCVTPAADLRGGDRGVVRIITAAGRAYHYPVQAKWLRTTGSSTIMGLPFIGVPLQVSSQHA